MRPPSQPKTRAFGLPVLMLGLLALVSPSGPAQAQVPVQVQAPAPALPSKPQPLYAIVGYELRQEYLSEDDWRQLLGPAQYRQSVASRVLPIVGGLVLFGGVTALLATFGSLAQNSDYGSKAALLPGASPVYQPYIYGFSAVTGVGGALLLTGLVLSLPLPPRRRAFSAPRLQAVQLYGVPLSSPPPAR